MDLDELVFHPWVAQGPRSVPTFVGGSGSYLIDADGRRYLDFSSQLVFTNLGHQHPRIVAAIKQQADRLCTLAPAHASDIRGEAAQLIVEVAPEGLGHVLFTTGGTEAIEHAVRMARLHNGRPKVLAAYRSYHGSTTTSIHLSGDPRRWANDTGAAGAVHFFGPFLYRSVFGSETPEEECDRALAHLEQVILLEGLSTISALVLESVIGSSGDHRATSRLPARGPRPLHPARHRVHRRRGDRRLRPHRRLVRRRPRGCRPDLLVFAKGVNSGYVPLGGVLVGDPIFETFTKRPYPAGMTYSGHPLACAAAVGAIGAMHDEGTVAAAARLGTESSGRAHRARRRRIPVSAMFVASGACGPSNSSATGRPRSRSGRWAPPGDANAPMTAFARPASTATWCPLVLGNRIHVAPPLNLTDADAPRAWSSWTRHWPQPTRTWPNRGVHTRLGGSLCFHPTLFGAVRIRTRSHAALWRALCTQTSA